ncbi:MAG: hypothetical protein DBY30_09860 [Verrucomicrobia bacterium]|nr:MAG: hypothetical protein DBY30_09860 [Verrucomicrobiota bacterium]
MIAAALRKPAPRAFAVSGGSGYAGGSLSDGAARAAGRRFRLLCRAGKTFELAPPIAFPASAAPLTFSAPLRFFSARAFCGVPSVFAFHLTE